MSYFAKYWAGSVEGELPGEQMLGGGGMSGGGGGNVVDTYK